MTEPLFVVVRLEPLVAAVPVLDDAHPVNLYPPAYKAVDEIELNVHVWSYVQDVLLGALEHVAPLGQLILYATVYLLAEQLGLYAPPFTIVLYPVLHDVAYVHVLLDTLNVHVAPVPAEHAVHVVHLAYNVTFAPVLIFLILPPDV